MREMLWQTEPAAVEMFTFKKHMVEDPKYQDEEIGAYGKQKYEELKTSRWGQSVLGVKPKGAVKVFYNNEIDNDKLPAHNGNHLKNEHATSLAKSLSSAP